MASDNNGQGTRNGPQKLESFFENPVLVDVFDRNGGMGPFRSFTLKRAYLDRSLTKQESPLHVLNRWTIHQLRKVLDQLEERLEDEPTDQPGHTER